MVIQFEKEIPLKKVAEITLRKRFLMETKADWMDEDILADLSLFVYADNKEEMFETYYDLTEDLNIKRRLGPKKAERLLYMVQDLIVSNYYFCDFIEKLIQGED